MSILYENWRSTLGFGIQALGRGFFVSGIVLHEEMERDWAQYDTGCRDCLLTTLLF